MLCEMIAILLFDIISSEQQDAKIDCDVNWE